MLVHRFWIAFHSKAGTTRTAASKTSAQEPLLSARYLRRILFCSTWHKKKGMKTYYEDVLKECDTGLRFPSFMNGGGVTRLEVAMPDDKALGEWESHTLLGMQ